MEKECEEIIDFLDLLMKKIVNNEVNYSNLLLAFKTIKIKVVKIKYNCKNLKIN